MELEKEYKKVLLHNLFFGIWSLPGVIMVPITLYRNRAALKQLRELVKEDKHTKPAEPKWSYVMSFFKNNFAFESQKNPMDIRESLRNFVSDQINIPKDKILLSQLEEILQAVYEPYLDNDDLADIIEDWHPHFRASAAGISYKDILERMRSYLKKGDSNESDEEYWNVNMFNTFRYRFRNEIGDNSWYFRLKNDDFLVREPIGVSSQTANVLNNLVTVDIGTDSMALLDYRNRFAALKVWHSNFAPHYLEKEMIVFPKSSACIKSLRISREVYDKFFDQLTGFLSAYPRRNRAANWVSDHTVAELGRMDFNTKISLLDGIHSRLEFLLKGINYTTWFGIQKLPNSTTSSDAIEAINKRFPQSKVSEKYVTESEWLSAWKDIEKDILFSNPVRDEALERLNQMKLILDSLVDQTAHVYSSGKYLAKTPEHLDNGATLWRYRFIVLKPNSESFMLFGGASD